MPLVEKELLIPSERLYIHPAWFVLFVLSNYTFSRFYFGVVMSASIFA